MENQQASPTKYAATQRATLDCGAPRVWLSGIVLWLGACAFVATTSTAPLTRDLLGAGLLGALALLLIRVQRLRQREQQMFLHQIEHVVATRTAKLQKLNETLSLKTYAINHIKESIFLVSPAGEIMYANEEAARSLGYPREELIGLRVHDVDPSVNETTWQAHWRQLEAKEALRFESNHRRKDGSAFPVDISANLFCYAGKQYNLGFARDITTRKAFESKLVDSERRYRSLVESIPDFIVRFDRDCRHLYVNPSVARAFGRPAQDFVGKRLHELHLHSSSDQDQKLESSIRAAFDTGLPNEVEACWGNSEGKMIHEVRHIPEIDSAGNVVCVIGIARKVTDRVRIMHELAESREQLRQITALRDTAREEERKHMAREIHDELGQMLTSLRMELSTLILQHGDSIPGFAGNCRRLIDSVDRNILFVRTIATALRPAVLDMGLATALDWLVAEFRKRSPAECQLSVSTYGHPFKEALSVALFRITQEALTNISRHAEAKHVAITLSMDNGACRLVIRDDGKGFDRHARRADTFGLLGIFERSLMLGGTARIDSVPGSGTTVDISIPCTSSERTQS